MGERDSLGYKPISGKHRGRGTHCTLSREFDIRREAALDKFLARPTAGEGIAERPPKTLERRYRQLGFRRQRSG